MDSISIEKALKGAEFLLKDENPQQVFTSEEYDEEQLMIRDMIRDFNKNRVEPNWSKIEKQLDNMGETILKEMGGLGLFGAHIPESFGGMPMGTNTVTLIAEEIGASGASSVSFAAQTGIGMLPILYFGTEAQKQKYLPKLVTGEWIISYCLTEPSSGSDALAAKAKAILSEDESHYVLNGQKMWITNAGWADLFIVFAKVDGEQFTGFIVEKGMEGLTLGAEEDKLGIKGSSTRQVFFENVKVPVENVLGKIGKGHKIAFNVLNNGRFKLGALCLGAAKRNLRCGIEYANEREQFQKKISEFGAIKFKIGEQVIKLFVLESAQYRASGLRADWKKKLIDEGMEHIAATLKADEEFAAECALLKVLGSETLDYVVDETVQIFGGNGFSEEFPAASAYRDSRINRIYEGTNEINRMLMVDTILKRAMKGQIDLMSGVMAVQQELLTEAKDSPASTDPIEGCKQMVTGLKKALLLVAGAAVQAQMEGKINLKEDQEILMNISDIASNVFAAESVVLRMQKMKDLPYKAAAIAAMEVYCHDACMEVKTNAYNASLSFAEDKNLSNIITGVNRFCKTRSINVMKKRREVANLAIKQGAYCFEA